SVNGLLGEMLPEPPELSCEVAPPEDWLAGRSCRWSATDRTGAEVALDQLSGAQMRLTRLALTLVLEAYERGVRPRESTNTVCSPAIVLLDEPEAGLHRPAEDKLTQALVDYGARNEV